MRTSCEIFAENGHPMDSRVPMTFGLVNEPARAVLKSDGSLHLTDDEHYREINWGKLDLPPRKGDGAYKVKPQLSNAEARRRCNLGIRGHRAPIFAKPNPKADEPVRGWEANPDKQSAAAPVTVDQTFDQKQAEFRKFLETERAANAARRAARLNP